MHVLAYLKAKCSIPCQIMTLMEQFAFEFQLWFDKVILNVITSGHLLGHHRALCGCAGHWCHYCCFLSECQNSGPGHIKASVLGPGLGVQCSHSVDDKTKHKEACPESIAPQDLKTVSSLPCQENIHDPRVSDEL